VTYKKLLGYITLYRNHSNAHVTKSLIALLQNGVIRLCLCGLMLMEADVDDGRRQNFSFV